MDKQQTAVTWLIGELISNKLMALRYDSDNTFNELVAKAREMEKDQSVKFGKKVADHWGISTVPESIIEQYYNETYGNNSTK